MSPEHDMQTVLQKLVAQQPITAAERARLSAALDEMDDGMAAALDALPAHALAAAFAPRSAEVTPIRPPNHAPGRPARRWRWVGGLAVAASALFAVLLLPPRRPASDGIKGAGAAPQVELQMWRGVYEGGVPAAGPALGSGDEVPPDAAVLLRYTLFETAWVSVWVHSDGAAERLHDAGERAAGAHEVAEGGQVLALRPAELGAVVTVAVIAAPSGPAAPDSLPSLEPAAIEAACPRCGYARRLLRVRR